MIAYFGWWVICGYYFGVICMFDFGCLVVGWLFGGCWYYFLGLVWVGFGILWFVWYMFSRPCRWVCSCGFVGLSGFRRRIDLCCFCIWWICFGGFGLGLSGFCVLLIAVVVLVLVCLGLFDCCGCLGGLVAPWFIWFLGGCLGWLAGCVFGGWRSFCGRDARFSGCLGSRGGGVGFSWFLSGLFVVVSVACGVGFGVGVRVFLVGRCACGCVSVVVFCLLVGL